MPRGSRPGERRGGRQRGTPNKKTLLKDAIFLAAASEPDRSPLDFMLALMRDSQVPLHLRLDMAAAAAPLVHGRPRASRRDRPHPMERRARNAAESGGDEKPALVDGEKQHGLAGAGQGLAGGGKAGTKLPGAGPLAEKIAEYERLLKERDRQVEKIAVPENIIGPSCKATTSA
jgi:hypothetical protein